MQQSNLPSSIRDRIPEYVVDSYPVFVDFIQTYYEYAYQRTAGVGSIQNRALDTDVDSTLDEYVDEFYRTYGPTLPRSLAADKRNFVKLLNSIYNAKGSENALKLLFQGIFGERVTVSYPGENVLRASDGKWVQERFFTAVTKFGAFPNELPYDVEFTNGVGSFSVQVTKVELDDPGSARISFDAKTPVYAANEQLFTIYSPEGDTVWIGELIETPGRLEIVTPGAAWQVGQVVIIPGTYKNTVARVTRVSSTGGMENIEILEHGFGHVSGQLTTMSPYPSRPPASEIEITSEMVSFDPPIYTHTISINDYTDGFTETIIGVTDSSSSSNTYFLENYVVPGYAGTTVIGITAYTGTTIASRQDIGLTYQEWLDSRATIEYIPQNIVKARGYYSTFDGHLSNQEVHLQDNYFYQAFSYLVETTKDIREYKNTLKSVHPAGTKMFADLVKQTEYAFNITSSRTLSLDTLYLLDYVNLEQSVISLNFTKRIEDLQVMEDLTALTLNKVISDSVSMVSGDTVTMESTSYAETSYTEENYAVIDFEISIG